MKIKRWDWDKQNFVWDEYPEAMFETFLNWILRTKMWTENPVIVEEHVRSLDRELMEYRTPPNTHREADAPIRVAALEAVAAPQDFPIPDHVEEISEEEIAKRERYRLAGLKRSETMRKKREAREKRKAARAAKEVVHAEG